VNNKWISPAGKALSDNARIGVGLKAKWTLPCCGRALIVYVFCATDIYKQILLPTKSTYPHIYRRLQHVSSISYSHLRGALLCKSHQGKRIPGQVLRVPGDSRWKGCQPYAQATFTPQEIFLVLISVRGWVDPLFILFLSTWSTYSSWPFLSPPPIR